MKCSRASYEGLTLSLHNRDRRYNKNTLRIRKVNSLIVLCCRSAQSVPSGGPGGVSSAGVGAGVLSADGRHRGELASEHQIPAARLLHLRPHLGLRGQGQRASTHTCTHAFLLQRFPPVSPPGSPCRCTEQPSSSTSRSPGSCCRSGRA